MVFVLGQGQLLLLLPGLHCHPAIQARRPKGHGHIMPRRRFASCHSAFRIPGPPVDGISHATAVRQPNARCAKEAVTAAQTLGSPRDPAATPRGRMQEATHLELGQRDREPVVGGEFKEANHRAEKRGGRVPGAAERLRRACGHFAARRNAGGTCAGRAAQGVRGQMSKRNAVLADLGVRWRTARLQITRRRVCCNTVFLV